jgi:DHA1 family bicyclomycin/chloramphenicol resistance-like MFS transporter
MLSKPEFVCMMALMMAVGAFSIDAMLPAFPQIISELTPDAPNRVQFIVMFFTLGMGVGTLFTGPLSDQVGRKPVMLGGVILYVFGAIICWKAETLNILLAGRLVQGLGVSATRAVSMAMVRDLYKGRAMAQITSLIMMVFIVFPAVAPSFGTFVLTFAEWRAIFIALMCLSVTGISWLMLRQTETLALEHRRPFNVTSFLSGVREILSQRIVVIMIIVQGFAFGSLLSMLSSIQQIFDIGFGRADSFHLWFAGLALLSGGSGAVNAMIVQRIGMRVMISAVLRLQILISGCAVILLASGVLAKDAEFVVFLFFVLGLFCQISLLMGNTMALAMETLGDKAGLAASVMGSLGTLCAVVLAVPVGLAFNGTPLPLMIGAFIFSSISFGATLFLPNRADA